MWCWTLRKCYILPLNINGHFVESLQSHMILTMSHWSSGLTCLLPATRVTGSNPLGGLMWNRDSPVSVVCYIGDPDVIDHQQGFIPNCHQALVPTMWQSHLISHSFPVPVLGGLMWNRDSPVRVVSLQFAILIRPVQNAYQFTFPYEMTSIDTSHLMNYTCHFSKLFDQ